MDMFPSKSVRTCISQCVTQQVAYEKTSQKTQQVAYDKTSSDTCTKTNVTELALLILGVGCGLTLAVTAMAISGPGSTTLPMSQFLSSSTRSRPVSIFSDEYKDPLPVALANPGNSIATVIRHTLSGSKPARKKGLLSWGAAYAQATPPEALSAPSDVAPPVTTIAPPVTSEGSVLQPGLAMPPPWMDLGVKVEELQNWIGNVRAGCLFKPVVILLMVSTLLGLSYGLKAVLRDRKSSEVFLNDNQGGASVELSWSQRMPAEDDIMEAFDAFDYKRLGFIDRATVNHVLGHMALPGHLDAAAPFLGSVKKLFYDDFRRLAQQPGPFADVVTQRVSKRQKRKAADAERRAAFDDRCNFGLEVDMAQIAISPISHSPPKLYRAIPSTSAPGAKRSWAELREELAPKSQTKCDCEPSCC